VIRGPLYQIKDWDATYENYKSRERGLCGWCSVPNKQSGLGYLRLINQNEGNGPAMYGCFVAIVLLASKQRKPRNGYLTDTGRVHGTPLTAEDISLTVGMPSGLVQLTLEACASHSIGWLCVIDGYKKDTAVPAGGYQEDTVVSRSIQKKEEKERKKEPPLPAREDASTACEVKKYLSDHPEYAALIKSPHFRGFAVETYHKIFCQFQKADAKAAVKKAIFDAEMETRGLTSPAHFLSRRFSDSDRQGGRRDTTGATPVYGQRIADVM